jgi:hypothetical protein
MLHVGETEIKEEEEEEAIIKKIKKPKNYYAKLSNM